MVKSQADEQLARKHQLMKAIVQILLTILVGGAIELFLPWWTIAIAAFIVAIPLSQKGAGAFWSGFAGVALLWGGYALFIGINTNFVLSAKIAELMKVGSPLILVLLTAILGGLVGGLSSLTGYFLKDLWR